MFAVDPSTGVVTVLVSLDREQSPRHKFNVYAVDGGTPAALTATARVIVNVVDLNDERPIFTRHGGIYSFRVAERLPAGAEVGTVRARDADAPPNNRFRYELVHEDLRSTPLFSLNTRTGLLTTNRRLDREQSATYRMLATARDNADISLVSTATIVVTVDDVNDNPPEFLFPVPRNRTARVATSGGHVRRGRRVTTVRATDADEGPNGHVTYAIVPSHGDRIRDDNNDDHVTRRRDHYFRINATSGDIVADRNFRVSPGSANATFRLTLEAVDGGRASLRTFSDLILIFDDGPVKIDLATPPHRRDRLTEASGGRLMMSDQNVEAVVAVCVVTVIVAAVLLAAIVFVGCHQRVATATRRLGKPSSSPPCYQQAAVGTSAGVDYGDSPCSKSSAAPLVAGRSGYVNHTGQPADLVDESLLPASSPGGVIVRLIDRKYSLSGRREVTSGLLYPPNFGCQL